jgi:hypothetical protein
MSQKWVYLGIEQLSAASRRQMLEDSRRYIFFGGHDNLNIPFKVYEMPMDRQSNFDSGIAGTIYIVKNPTAVPPDRLAHMEKRAIGCENLITTLNIFKRGIAAGSRLCEENIFFIKRFLLMHPACAKWKDADHPLFAHPSPVQSLPTGKEHATC